MRQRFKRSCISSSRGGYVRKSHYTKIQKELEDRGVVASLKDIIEVDITISLRPKQYGKYIVRCFGKEIEITADEAMKLPQNLVIRL